MSTQHFNLLLADDDTDDCTFFKEALKGSQLSTHLTAVHDGEQLMQLLTKEANELPHVLFLDLNMPRKSGFECLSEIKLNEKLKQLPVVIFTTSFQQEVVDLLYKNGAQYCVRKPAEFSQLQGVIQQALILISQAQPVGKEGNISQPTRETFVLKVQKSLVI